jgi:K+-transporting ATPase A subunit
MRRSRIDFGLPWMFIPVFLYGMLAGVTYEILSQRIRHEEMRAGLLAVIFWLSLYCSSGPG